MKLAVLSFIIFITRNVFRRNSKETLISPTDRKNQLQDFLPYFNAKETFYQQVSFVLCSCYPPVGNKDLIKMLLLFSRKKKT